MKNKIKKIGFFGLTFIVVFLSHSSCRKEYNVIYELNDVTIEQSSINKEHLKTPTEYISIAYSDIFGTVITTSKLYDLTRLYLSIGDKELIEDLIIKNFLNEPTNLIPSINRISDTTINDFVSNTYKKLLNRDPDEYELWFVSDMIEQDTSINSEHIYFSLMSSNEYRYY